MLSQLPALPAMFHAATPAELMLAPFVSPFSNRDGNDDGDDSDATTGVILPRISVPLDDDQPQPTKRSKPNVPSL
jgi:hypothetical protein